jgi:hypothetical protein
MFAPTEADEHLPRTLNIRTSGIGSERLLARTAVIGSEDELFTGANEADSMGNKTEQLQANGIWDLAKDKRNKKPAGSPLQTALTVEGQSIENQWIVKDQHFQNGCS